MAQRRSSNLVHEFLVHPRGGKKTAYSVSNLLGLFYSTMFGGNRKKTLNNYYHHFYASRKYSHFNKLKTLSEFILFMFGFIAKL